MHLKKQPSAYLRSGISNLFFISVLLIVSSFTPLQAFISEDENPIPLHKLATRILPELDVTIFEVLETLGAEKSVSSKVSAQTYRLWHARVQAIENTPIPPNAQLLVDHLLPAGFDSILKNHIFVEPRIDEYSREDLVLYYFLQIVGTAIKQNKELEPLQTELSELFECNNRNCMMQADITDADDTPMSSSDEEKLQRFNECMLVQSSLTVRMKEEFCDSFLFWTIQ